MPTLESIPKRLKSSSIARPPKSAAKARDIREPLNMRVRPDVRSLIDHAAEITGKNRTDFVLDAARQAAQNAVLDQTILSMNSKAHAAFIALLDASPKPNDRLRKSLQTKAVWE